MYKVIGIAHGREVSRFVRADSADAAVAKFVEEWTLDGDDAPTGVYVAETWAVTV